MDKHRSKQSRAVTRMYQETRRSQGKPQVVSNKGFSVYVIECSNESSNERNKTELCNILPV